MSAATNVYGPASTGRVRNASTVASRSSAITDIRDVDRLVTPQGFDEFVHPPGGHPEQVAGRRDRAQGPLGMCAAFQQPVRDVGTVAWLRDREIH